MGEEVIAQVHSLAKKEGRKRFTNNFNFEWRPGTAVAETPIEENYEETPWTEEPVGEEQGTQDDCSEQSELEDDGGTPSVEVDGDENGEIDRATQDTDDLPPSWVVKSSSAYVAICQCSET